VLDVGKIVMSGPAVELLASEKIQEAYLGKKQ
jgi:branched-chain amino acid transport system ATP-binding protein